MKLWWWVLIQYTGVLIKRGKFGQRDTEMRLSGKDRHRGNTAIWTQKQRLLSCQAMSRVPRIWRRKGRILPNYATTNVCVFKPLIWGTFYGGSKNLIKCQHHLRDNNNSREWKQLRPIQEPLWTLTFPGIICTPSCQGVDSSERHLPSPKGTHIIPVIPGDAS